MLLGPGLGLAAVLLLLGLGHPLQQEPGRAPAAAGLQAVPLAKQQYSGLQVWQHPSRLACMHSQTHLGPKGRVRQLQQQPVLSMVPPTALAAGLRTEGALRMA